MLKAATDTTALAMSGEVRELAGSPGRAESFLPSPCVQNHAANLAVLANGDLACVWFGGTQEGRSDISIYFSRLRPGTAQWTPAVRLSDDADRSEQNPLLFPAPGGKLWLLWTAQFAGNQHTACVRCRLSGDHGETWGPVSTLFEAAGGRGIFIRQPVLVLPGGDWLLPVFFCHGVPGHKWTGDDDHSAVMISRDQGQTWSKHAVPESRGCVHMGIVRLRDASLLALFRSRWADAIYSSRSADDGRTWTPPTPTSLPNNNSSIQVCALANGHLALVFNDTNATAATARRESLYDGLDDATREADRPVGPAARRAFWGTPRAPLTIAVSDDEGRTWRWKRNLEVGDGYCLTNNSTDKLNREYSYPSVKQTADGMIHVAYTYFRQAIKYARITEDWVRGGE